MPLDRLVLLVVLALSPLAGAGAQSAAPEAPATPEVVFERASGVEAALPQSSVYAVVEDKRGFLWFATREGLGRWDGTTMRTWRRDPFNAASLPGNLVRRLVEDDAGDLWASTEATDWTPTGIARLVGPAHDEVRRYGHAGAEPFVGPDGRAWLADSTHLWRFDAARDAFVRERQRLRPARARRGLSAPDGTVWVASDEGIEAYPPGAPARHVQTDGLWDGAEGNNPSFGPLAMGTDGSLWVGGSRLGRLRPGASVIEMVDLPLPVIHGYGTGLGLNIILPDREGLWLGTLDGVYRYRFADGSHTRYSLRLAGDIPTQNWVTGFAKDRAGTLWAGTVWGLHRATTQPPPFRLLSHDPDDPNSLGSGIVLSIHRDARGALWVGTLGGGLNRMDPDGTVTRYRHASGAPRTLSHDWVWSLASDDETLWIGTGEGLNAIDLNAPEAVQRFTYRENPADGFGPSAAGLHLDSTGTLWFGHIGGLYRRAPDGTVRVTQFKEGIQDIVRIPGGAWITSGDGLLRYDETEDAIQRYRYDPDDPASLSDDATMALHLDRRQRLWVGTQSGLDLYDPETDGFTHFTTEDGLPGSAVYAILEDAAGRLWMSTNRGLARYDESAPQRFRAYTEADGVGNVEFNRHAAWQDADGTMYFGGDRGVTLFHPDDLTAPSRLPPVVVTAMRRSLREGTARDTYVPASGVTLAPEVTTFGFEFAALDFVHAHQNRYAVRLEGWDEGWVEVGAQRQATYTNLPPGSYTFRVRAANADGVWGEDAAIPVVVQPHFWQTAWFRLLALLAAIGAVAGTAWSLSRRRYRRELAALKARQALDAERARISRDMHDEVGASLSEIAILSEIAQLSASGDGGPGSGASLSSGPPAGSTLPNPGASGAPPEAASRARLRQIAETSRETLDSIAEIIWAINPTNDRLPTLAAYLREHAARYTETAGLRATLRFPAHPPDRPVSAELRRNVFLVLKEALHNVVKHAGASGVDVSLLLDGDALTLLIADDGCGVAEAPSGDGAPARTRIRGGNGLGNMQVRAEEIGGTLLVAPGETGGTLVRLHVPLAPEAASVRG